MRARASVRARLPAKTTYMLVLRKCCTCIAPDATDCATPASVAGRLILSQSTDGWWDASPNTAFVLESRAAAETKELPATLMTRVLTILGTIAQASILEDTDDDGRRDDASTALDDVLGTGDQAHAKSSAGGVDESLAPEDATSTTPRSASLRRIASMTRAANINDCPLTCSVSAITASMPRRLSALRTSDAAVELTRVWTTMLCISVLERLNNSWIWGDGCVHDASHHSVRVRVVCAARVRSRMLKLTRPPAIIEFQ